MGSYFAYRHMAPFGNSTLLTVDLGQQYVDFFCLFPPHLAERPKWAVLYLSKSFGGWNVWCLDLLLIKSIQPDFIGF